MAMAVVEATPRVRDADDRTREGRRRVAHGSRERAPEIEREVLIAVVGEPPRQSFAHRPSRPSPRAFMRSSRHRVWIRPQADILSRTVALFARRDPVSRTVPRLTAGYAHRCRA